MSHQAQVQLAGRAVSSPRKISGSDPSRPHVVVRIALNNGFYDNQGNWQAKETTFLDVNCWGKLARHVLVSVDKGHPLIVLGKLETRSWLSKESGNEGERRTALSVYATHVGIDLNEREAQVIKTERVTEKREFGEEDIEAPKDSTGVPAGALAGALGDAPAGMGELAESLGEPLVDSIEGATEGSSERMGGKGERVFAMAANATGSGSDPIASALENERPF